MRRPTGCTTRSNLAIRVTYMKRIADFADTHPDVVHIRFTGLLEDWRGTIGMISDRLDIRLDLRAHADEIDEFLEPALRRQVSHDEALTEVLDDSELAEIHSLYQAFLASCNREAGLTRGMVRSGGTAR